MILALRYITLLLAIAALHFGLMGDGSLLICMLGGALLMTYLILTRDHE